MSVQCSTNGIFKLSGHYWASQDKLKKLEVDVGGEVLKIVTNASNVKDAVSLLSLAD